MTDAIRRGLLMSITLSDSWREADGDETLSAQEISDLEAVENWIARGGLTRERPDPAEE